MFRLGVIIRPSDISGDPGDVFGITLKVYSSEDYGGGYISTPVATGNGFYGVQGIVNAGNTRGPHYMSFDISYSYKDINNYTRNSSVVFSVPYNVLKLGITVNKATNTTIPYNTKDRISWWTVDAVKCTRCMMINSKFPAGTACPAGFLNNPEPRLYGFFETDNMTEDTTFNITCDNIPVSSVPPPGGEVYYQLFPCNSSNIAAEYKTSTESWDSGTLVQGATGVYYIVAGSNTNDDPGKTNVAGITKETDLSLCK